MRRAGAGEVDGRARRVGGTLLVELEVGVGVGGVERAMGEFGRFMMMRGDRWRKRRIGIDAQRGGGVLRGAAAGTAAVFVGAAKGSGAGAGVGVTANVAEGGGERGAPEARGGVAAGRGLVEEVVRGQRLGEGGRVAAAAAGVAGAKVKVVVAKVVVVVVLGDDGGGVVPVVVALERGEGVGVGQGRGVCARRLLEGVHKGGAWAVVAAVGSSNRGSRRGTSVVVARPVHGRPANAPTSSTSRTTTTAYPAPHDDNRRRRRRRRRHGHGHGHGRLQAYDADAGAGGRGGARGAGRGTGGRTGQVEAGASRGRRLEGAGGRAAVAQVDGLVLPAAVEVERVLGRGVQFFEDGLDHVAVVMAGHGGGEFMHHDGWGSQHTRGHGEEEREAGGNAREKSREVVLDDRGQGGG